MIFDWCASWCIVVLHESTKFLEIQQEREMENTPLKGKKEKIKMRRESEVGSIINEKKVPVYPLYTYLEETE